MKRIRFNEIDEKAPEQPGIYEIHTNDGTALKVGIGKNLRKRLIQHRDSRQSRLKLIPGGNWSNPSDVVSKGSILAKHLFFDEIITKNFNLKTENGRKEFLMKDCYILFEITATREEAWLQEQTLEDPALYRYVGRVVIHDR
jgi:hypothetical protein